VSNSNQPPSDPSTTSPAGVDGRSSLGQELKSALGDAWRAADRLAEEFVAGDSPGHDLAELRRALAHADQVAEALLQASQYTPREQPALDINALLSAMEPFLRKTIDPAITLSIQGAEPAAVVFANGDEVGWVIRTLVDAAVEAMPEGGDLAISAGWLDHISCRALRSGLPPSRYVRLTIGDTGAGRSSDTWQRTREPRSIDDTVEDSISAVVGRLGGCLIFENASGSGSRVHVCLPAAHETPDSPPDTAA
jgi:hypothetical protein